MRQSKPFYALIQAHPNFQSFAKSVVLRPSIDDAASDFATFLDDNA
jgi:hypothetical protein